MSRIVPMILSFAVGAVAAAGISYYVMHGAANNTTASVRADSSSRPDQTGDAVKKSEGDLKDKLAKAEARVRELEEAATKPDEPAKTPEDNDKKPNAKKPSLDEIRAAIQKNAGASAQIQAITELMYADLFKDLDLSPENKAALRQLLLDEYKEEMALSQYAMSKGDVPWNQVAKWRDEERAALDQQVQALLDKEKYKTWHDYADAIDDRSVEASLRNQIRAFSSGLTDANFEAVMQVAMDEFRAEQEALDRSNTPFTVAENLNYQIRAMDGMRDRLRQSLPADQFAEIENWLNMGTNLFKQQLAALQKKA